MVDAIIDIQDLRTQFGRTVIHDQLNLQIKRGEILSIVGGSGAGKTVLMRQMLGLQIPIRGNIKVFGEDLHDPNQQHLDYLRKRSGMLFQHGALYSALTVFENVAQPMRELGTLPDDLITDLVYLKLQMVGINFEHARKMPSDLSGGMIKRIALARALALDPEFLYSEPRPANSNRRPTVWWRSYRECEGYYPCPTKVRRRSLVSLMQW